MYKFFKKIAKKILPQNVLFKNEEFIRNLMSPLYKGNNHECNICNSELKNFILNRNLICPICGSLPRTRRLWKIFNESFLQPNIHLLDFSPSRSIYRKIKKNPTIFYYPTDFENEFLATYRYDITNIDCPNEKFDLIFCYHILEHIEEDQKAMKELFRVLKPHGNCLIQTPFKGGEIYEDFSIKTPEDRLKHYGQNDHVRIYSVEGLKSRLENVGFHVEIKTFEKDERFGLTENERILFCSKS